MDEQTTMFEFAQRPTIKGFPELRWTGKRPYRSTQYYPAQLRESYGQGRDGWINKIFWGDNLQVMSHLLRDYRGQIDLVYIDPPFDSKADYKKSIRIKSKNASSDTAAFEEKQYGDMNFLESLVIGDIRGRPCKNYTKLVKYSFLRLVDH